MFLLLYTDKNVDGNYYKNRSCGGNIYTIKISLFILKITCMYCINVLITVSRLRIKLIVLD